MNDPIHPAHPDRPEPDAGFVEVADRVWVARYAWWDVNVTAVAGGDGLLVVDTHASAAAARRVIDDVRALGAGEVRALVNTHEHFDHVFGNHAFRTAYGEVPIHAHEVAAANTVTSGLRDRQQLHGPGDPHHDEVFATEIVPADHTFSSAVALDLGDRLVELVHPGRGHTAGDLVVRVPDADVLLAGDLVEESGSVDGVAVPGLGEDCYPLDWPLTLDVLLALSAADTVVVPGHGCPVGRDFVEEQRGTLGIVAETIRDLAGRGVPEAEALDAGQWPWPRERLRQAVARGYAQLPRSQRRLPLV